jgi:hypothetical protein
MDKKNSARVVHTALVPANRPKQAWFGLLDGTVSNISKSQWSSLLLPFF